MTTIPSFSHTLLAEFCMSFSTEITTFMSTRQTGRTSSSAFPFCWVYIAHNLLCVSTFRKSFLNPFVTFSTFLVISSNTTVTSFTNYFCTRFVAFILFLILVVSVASPCTSVTAWQSIFTRFHTAAFRSFLEIRGLCSKNNAVIWMVLAIQWKCFSNKHVSSCMIDN